MCLDLVTYILMMIIFGGFVILHEAGDTFDWMEIVFTMYIFVRTLVLLLLLLLLWWWRWR